MIDFYNKSFRFKLLFTASIVLLGIILGSGLLMLILTSYEIDLESLLGNESIALESTQNQILKIGFGLNHFVSFVIPGLLLFAIIIGPAQKQPRYTFDITLFGKFIILLVLAYPVFGILMGIMQSLPLPESLKQLDNSNMEAMMQLLKMDSFLDFLLNFLIIAIFAGVGEELIFRGVLQNILSDRISAISALVLAAFIFAIFHLEFTGLLAKFGIGLVLGYSYYITQNIIYPILLHILNNGTQLIIVYLFPEQLSEESLNAEFEYSALFGLLVFIPLIYLMTKHIYEKYAHGSNA